MLSSCICRTGCGNCAEVVYIRLACGPYMIICSHATAISAAHSAAGIEAVKCSMLAAMHMRMLRPSSNQA